MFCTPTAMSVRLPNACTTEATDSAGGKRMTVRSSRGVHFAANAAASARACVGPWFIFQFAAKTGRRMPCRPCRPLLVVERGDAGQLFALEKLERRAAAGRHVTHRVRKA